MVDEWTTDFHLKTADLSCFLATLFSRLVEPCECLDTECVTLHGLTQSGKSATVYLRDGRYQYVGDKLDYEEARNMSCLWRKCE